MTSLKRCILSINQSTSVTKVILFNQTGNRVNRITVAHQQIYPSKSYLGEGIITDDPYGMDGGIAVCEIRDLQKLMKYLCKNGFEHHIAMVRGHVAEIVEETVGNYLGWDLNKHN